MHGGCLFPPGYTRNGLSPGEFWGLIFQRQLLEGYRRDNLSLRLRVCELESRLASGAAGDRQKNVI